MGCKEEFFFFLNGRIDALKKNLTLFLRSNLFSTHQVDPVLEPETRGRWQKWQQEVERSFFSGRKDFFSIRFDRDSNDSVSRNFQSFLNLKIVQITRKRVTWAKRKGHLAKIDSLRVLYA